MGDRNFSDCDIRIGKIETLPEPVAANQTGLLSNLRRNSQTIQQLDDCFSLEFFTSSQTAYVSEILTG